MFMLCLYGMGAETETSLMNAYKITPWAANARTGTTAAAIELHMDNRNVVAKWNCTLYLPQGFTFNSAEICNDAGRYPDGYNAEFTATPNAADNTVSFSCSGEDGVDLNGKEGIVAMVYVDIPSTVTPGDYTLEVKNTSIEESDGSIHNLNPGTSCTWTIEQGIVYGTITFDLNGAPGEYAPITAPVGDPVGAPDDPEWEGHNFLGWDKPFPETMPEGGLLLTAQWELKKYQVYVEAGAEGLTISNMNPEYGTSVTITVNELPDQIFESLLINQDDVTASMTGNTYTISNVAADIYVWAFYKSTKQGITITQEYTPFSCSDDLDFTGSDLKAYIASGFNKATNQVVLVRAKEVPAYTGVLLIGTPGTYNIPYNETNCYYSSIFVPCIQGGWITPSEQTTGNYNYAFDVVEGEPGFYPITGNGIELPAQSAYLTLPANFAQAGVKVNIVIEEDVIDGINGVDASTTDGLIYNLAGQRIQKMQKGINIVNGKKILK